MTEPGYTPHSSAGIKGTLRIKSAKLLFTDVSSSSLCHLGRISHNAQSQSLALSLALLDFTSALRQLGAYDFSVTPLSRRDLMTNHA